jgi:hypothetical protein
LSRKDYLSFETCHWSDSDAVFEWQIANDN